MIWQNMHFRVFCTDILEFTTFFFLIRIYNNIKPDWPIPEADASYSSNFPSNVALHKFFCFFISLK